MLSLGACMVVKVESPHTYNIAEHTAVINGIIDVVPAAFRLPVHSIGQAHLRVVPLLLRISSSKTSTYWLVRIWLHVARSSFWTNAMRSDEQQTCHIYNTFIMRTCQDADHSYRCLVLLTAFALIPQGLLLCCTCLVRPQH